MSHAASGPDVPGQFGLLTGLAAGMFDVLGHLSECHPKCLPDDTGDIPDALSSTSSIGPCCVPHRRQTTHPADNVRIPLVLSRCPRLNCFPAAGGRVCRCRSSQGLIDCCAIYAGLRFMQPTAMAPRKNLTLAPEIYLDKTFEIQL